MTTTRDEIEAIRARHEAQSRHAYTWTHLDHAQCQADRAILLPLAERCLKAEAALDEAQARAQRAEERLAWKPITKALESGGPYLVTNNLKATLNDGSMSHVFLTRMIHQNGDEFSAYTDELRKVHNLSHFLPVARAAQTLKDRNDV